MHYQVLCSDYDGTLATAGKIAPHVVTALDKLRNSGRQLVMVTGRELNDLKTVCPYLNRFSYVVAENGAVLYHPNSDTVELLAAAPPKSLITEFTRRGVTPLYVGQVILATLQPHAVTVQEVIRDAALHMTVILNKEAVMILPKGTDKASGVKQALAKLSLSVNAAIGIGDAENDLPLLNVCRCGVAVQNALPLLKAQADWVTEHSAGEGVVELIEILLRNEAAVPGKQAS
jgi:hydroxymethylpyrimidine pyrophosphatase-like HAD family hydrolase